MKQIIIEFMGLPNAGKSTLAKESDNYLRHKNYVTQIYGVKMLPGSLVHRDRYYLRQLQAMNKAVNQMIDFMDSSVANVIIIDRGPWDAVGFFGGLIRAEFFSEEEVQKVENAMSVARDMADFVNLVVLVEVPVETSFRRRPYFDRKIKQDIVRDKDFLEALFWSYQDLKKELPENSLVLDGTRPIKKNIEIILEKIERIISTENQNHLRNCSCYS